MEHDYFSDRELGAQPRTGDEVTPGAWGGIVALVERLIATGDLGCGFPQQCQDDQGACGTDARILGLAVIAEIPALNWPLEQGLAPSTHVACDLVEFCFQHVGKPIKGRFHPSYGHYHLTFDAEAGREEYRVTVNRIFARNGLALELQSNGQVRRMGPPVLRDAMAAAVFRTEDRELDRLLEAARSDFLNPDASVRQDSLVKLWRAWERLKTLAQDGDKKASVSALLNRAAGEPQFRQVLDKDAVELTRIGNDFMIRHTEKGKPPVESSLHVDYLFHRLFALIWLCLKAREG